MNARDARKDLACVNSRLSGVAARMSAQPHTLDRCAAGLRDVAQRLDSLRGELGPLVRDPEIRPIFDSVRSQVDRVQRLLDAAASFYLGAAAAAAAVPGIYTVEGDVPTFAPQRSLKMDA